MTTLELLLSGLLIVLVAFLFITMGVVRDLVLRLSLAQAKSHAGQMAELLQTDRAKIGGRNDR